MTRSPPAGGRTLTGADGCTSIFVSVYVTISWHLRRCRMTPRSRWCVSVPASQLIWPIYIVSCDGILGWIFGGGIRNKADKVWWISYCEKVYECLKCIWNIPFRNVTNKWTLGNGHQWKHKVKYLYFFQVCISDCNGFQILCAQDYNISISKVDTEYATFIQNAMLSSKKKQYT